MIRKEGIEGYNIKYSLEELKIIPQYKKSFAVPENENIPYYLNKNTCKLEGEDFRPYPQNNIIEVSNYGRIKRGDSILDQIDDVKNHPAGGYLFCPEYPEDKNGHILYVYQLVADTWLPPHPKTSDIWVRHHINNNGYDNRPSNLIWLTQAEHARIPKPYMLK